MPLLPLIISAAFGATATPATPAPEAYAGPFGRTRLARWTYVEDPHGDGASRGLERGRFVGKVVNVPHAANPTTPGTKAAFAAFRGSTGWYRTTLRRPAGRYLVRFESVASRAEVFLDGQPVATHRRAYEPFEAVLPLDGRSHRLVVHADWRSPDEQSDDGLHRTWFNWGGINREVTLRRLHPRSDVTGLSIDTRLADDGRRALVTVAVRVHNRADARRDVPLLLRLARGSRTVMVINGGSVALDPGAAATRRVRFTVVDPALWRPGNGQLYDLRAIVPFESGYHVQVGLRQVSFRGGTLRINGRRIVLRGASLHEEAPGRGDALRVRDMDHLVDELHDIDANATRAQHPLSAPLLERLDRAGIAVWQQIGPVDSPGQFRTAHGRLRAAARQDVRDDLRALRLHPAVIAWSLACEVADAGAPEQGAFVDAAARELHHADPGRGVSVDVWGPHLPETPSLLYRSLDAVGVTSYLGWYEAPGATPAHAARLLDGRVQALRRVFPNTYVFVAELGAEGIAGAPSSAAGGRTFQARLLAGQLRRLPRDVGAFVWILRDFTVNPAFIGGTAARLYPALRLPGGSNQKGLFDATGHAKPAAAAVRDAFRRAHR